MYAIRSYYESMARLFARLKRLGPTLAGFIALAFVVLLQFSNPAPLERVRMQIFDFYQTAAPRDEPDVTRTTVVDIDEESIARFGQWPWPRTA